MDNTTGEARPLQSPSINYNDNENVPSAIEGVRQRFTPSTTMNNEYNQGHDEEYYADNPQTTPPANDRSVRIRVNNNNNNSGRGYFYPVSPRSNNSNSPASYLGRRQSNVSFASAGADYADQNRGDDASVASNQSPRSRSGSSIHIRNLTSSVGGFDEHVYNDDDQDILMEHSRSSHTRSGHDHDHDHDYRDDHIGDQDFGMSRSDSTIDLEHVVYDHHQHHEEGDHYPDIHEGGVIMPDHMNADHIHIDIEEEEENDNQPSKGRAKEINITSIIDEDRPDKSSDVEENPLPFVGSSIDALKQGVNKQRTRQRDPFFESLPYKSLLSLWNQTDPCAAGRRFMLISNYESKIFTSIEDLSSYLCRKLKETLVTYTPRIDSRRSRRSYRKGGSAKRAAAPVTTSAMLPFWVDIQSPTPEDMMKIETVFHLHPLTTEDCISNSCEPNSGSNIEKWETFPKYVYVVANGQPADAALDEMPPIEDEQPSRALPSVDTVSLNVIVFDHFTLTIHKGPLKSLDVVLTRIRTGDAASNQQNAGGRGGIGMGAGGAAAGQNPRKTMFINSSIASAPLTAELKPVKSYSPAISASNSVSNLAAAAAAAPDRTASYYEGLLSLPEDYFPPPRAPTTQQGGNVLTEPATFGQQSESTAVPPQPQERAGEQQAKTELQQQQPQQPQLLALDKPPTKRILDSPDWILYAFLDAMVDLYMPSVDALIDEVELLDEMVFILSQEEQSDLLRRIAVARRNIASMRRILWPKQKLISYLVSKRLSYISPYVQIYMRDVLDHIISCTEKLELTKELLNQSHSNYLARVNIEVSQASNHINEVMKRLGMITTIIGPMALIPGLWGMNVKVPGQDRDGLEWFFGICVGIAVIIITLLLIFRKKLF